MVKRFVRRCVKDRQITNWKQFTTRGLFNAVKEVVCQRASNHKLKGIHNLPPLMPIAVRVCQRSSNHKLKAIHNRAAREARREIGVSKIVKSQIESNSQRARSNAIFIGWCVKDRQITNWKQFTTGSMPIEVNNSVCQRSSNHKLKAIHNCYNKHKQLMSWCVKDRQITNWKQFTTDLQNRISRYRCVKDRQITNWKQFTTLPCAYLLCPLVCQRSSNHKLKAIHNCILVFLLNLIGVSKIVKSQIESNSQLRLITAFYDSGCVKDRQITNWKQFTTVLHKLFEWDEVCQRSSNHKLKAIHNFNGADVWSYRGVSKIVKSQIESNSKNMVYDDVKVTGSVKDSHIINWKQLTTNL